MGARRFGPDTGRFLSRDRYLGALADLGLTADPLTGNRYALAAGNPISYIEHDGRTPIPNGDGGATNASATTASHAQLATSAVLAGYANGSSGDESGGGYGVNFVKDTVNTLAGMYDTAWIDLLNVAPGVDFDHVGPVFGDERNELSYKAGRWAGYVVPTGAGVGIARGAGHLTRKATTTITARNAPNTAGARFVAESDGVVTDLVGKAPNAISIGHYPAYIRAAQTSGARTFSMSDEAWKAMPATEQWVRNQRFLDRAIRQGSEIRLATPVDAARPGNFFERELQYLFKHGFSPSADGSALIRGAP